MSYRYSPQVKANSLLTIIMSIPLLLSPGLKYQWFPEGVHYFFLFFWFAVSVYVVPVLLLIGIVLGFRIYLSRAADRSSLKWTLWGTSIGLIAEIVWVFAVVLRS